MGGERKEQQRDKSAVCTGIKEVLVLEGFYLFNYLDIGVLDFRDVVRINNTVGVGNNKYALNGIEIASFSIS